MDKAENAKYYNELKTPPEGSTKPIKGGNLKGYTEINPQWRIQAMTETFGPCGVGWWFEVTEEKTFNCPDGKIMLYLEVAVYYIDPESGKQSEPVYGWGGDFIIDKNKNGLVANDEAYKMAETDALGNALKCLGVGADVFMGLLDKKDDQNNANNGSNNYDGSKYSRDNYSDRKESGPAPKQQQQAAQANATERRNEHGELLITQAQQKRMFAIAGKGKEAVVKEVLLKHGYVKSSAEVTRHDYQKICEEIQELAQAG